METLKKLIFGKNSLTGGLTLLLVPTIIAFLMLMVIYEIPLNNRELASMIGGGLLAKLSTIIDFHFGSSKDSNERKENQ